MPYNIDLRFAAPVIFNILLYLIKYSSISKGQANQISAWDYFINDQYGWLYAMLSLVLFIFIIFVKLSISITVFAEPLMLQFGYFNLSVSLVFLMMASFLFPPQILLYAYLISVCIWISPFPSYVFDKIMNWLQQLPVFIFYMAQQPPNDLQAPIHQYFEVDHEEDDDENIEINVIFGHA